MKKKMSCLSLALGVLTMAASTAWAQSDGFSSPPSSSPPGWPGEGQNLMASRTLGVGIGTQITQGSDLFKPNVATVRFTATDSIIVEPTVILNYADRNDMSTTTLGVGTQLRYFLRSTGPLQLDFLGGAFLQHVGEENESNQTVNLQWGLGLSWFFAQNWGLSLDATNPLLTIGRTDPDGGDSSTNLEVGLIWRPAVLAMVHLYM